jgi:hypothetical protein
LSPFLKSGITDAVFHCVGNSVLESDKLNKRERGTQTVLHVFLSIWWLMESEYVCLWMIIVLLPLFYVIFLKHLIVTSSIVYRLWLEYEREISFANSLVRLKRLSAISLTYNKKSSGPSTEPWGTPAFVFTTLIFPTI